ncbi:ATP-dependent DNA helicase pif1-like [Zophobas morio]|uniref:ATP-dependent DNA helicase pif1-like n=1 Tax=Zophobas morio TaxID=2755281 RepID=UPI003082E997
MSEDILLRARRNNPGLDVQYSEDIFNEALISLEDVCMSINNKILNQLGLFSPERDRNDVIDRDVLREKQYDVDALQVYVETQKRLLTNDQRLAYDTIMEHVRGGNGGLLFLDAPGGTGKTFLLNLILAEIRMKHEIALAVASSGIAATLLDGGRTAHSVLKLPLNLNLAADPLCNIGKTTGMATVLKTCQLIIWDECTMAHKKGLEALDRTLRDFRSDERPLGGALILLAGDFRQTLPVIPRSTPADELNACLKNSSLWRHVKKITLSTNMRVHLLGDVSAQIFAKQLLDIGDGKLLADPTTQEIAFPPNFCQLQSSIEELEERVFSNIANNFRNHDWLCERAILAPKNDDVNRINNKIQLKVPGVITEYKSIDTVTEEDQAVNYPVEFLNSLEPPGMPPHILTLKVGSPILLLRNLNTPKLCNGTRLSVKKLMPNVIEATIISGKCKGEDVLIPRIPMVPTDLPFTFERLQFPVRLAFAMTINKAQGQSLRVAGLNLGNPCFSHGQLYVACSRVGTPKTLYVYTPNRKTKNIVYPLALR